MRKVIYDRPEMHGTHFVGWLTDTGWFHKFIIVREGRDDEVYALVETKTGEVVTIPRNKIKFQNRPPNE